MTSSDTKSIYETLKSNGVKYCLGAYVDIHGWPKGKIVPIDHFEHFAQGSELYTGYALDGLGQSPNDDEIASVPDLDHIIQLPWKPEVAWMPADNTFHEKPYEVSTRVAFRRILRKAESLGFKFKLGIECEVYFVKKDDHGRLINPNPNDQLTKPCYDVPAFFDQYALLDEIVTAINSLGWNVYSFDHEDGNSQFEFDFAYTDGLHMADRYIFFRFLAKHYAKKVGLIATFMPKPFADKTGNGAHFNMSLADINTGDNLFALDKKDDPKGLGLSTLGYSFIAGIIQHGQALCAAFAPSVNSYKRLVRRGAMSYYSWAPVLNSFGSNNRTNSIRVPMNGGRCESRNVDSSCNPYLAATLALAAGLEGIEKGLDPGLPHNENLYEYSDMELSEKGIEPLPQNLSEAVKAFSEDPFVEETLGSELTKEFITYKQQEWEAYHQSISQWEVDFYSGLY
ncbi:MAG: type III glutamate--ammonia ligase [Verrucomicrobiota bacterium]